MGDVVNLGGIGRAVEQKPASDEGGPHLSGLAVCGACKHEWQALIPVGETTLMCPKCARHWGALKHCVVPETIWTCRCGEELFWLTPTGAMCRRCGSRSNQWAE